MLIDHQTYFSKKNSFLDDKEFLPTRLCSHRS
ncbi:unnamed protein product [Spirodela intermedia]|uniref:Uncharacterized protein n=1 Tax=Spirodela intermedia TaxID=51605 RepID=A0A7I8IRX8_SPIIN|nr:unnamed protein product [Spirodela intermedia]CAA6660546.1 unnamed protein product [Spirodela intermedia]